MMKTEYDEERYLDILPNPSICFEKYDDSRKPLELHRKQFVEPRGAETHRQDMERILKGWTNVLGLGISIEKRGFCCE
jgi:hypothetical protein